MELSDVDLIARVLAHDDRHAFATLVHRHQGGVRGLLRRLCAGDLARADDLAQETFLRAYRGLAGYRGGAALSSWLYRIAYHVFCSRRPRHQEVELAAAPEPVVDSPATDPLLRERLTRAMASLSSSEVAALTLAYREEMSHGDIAAVLDLPVGTVKSHIVRGKDKLKRLLAASLPRRMA